ncbi:polyprenyl synthetase family protein [Massilia sp. W12]|uniref:polyprenyl synthetase family protein n=1 Tax=Massilia sp. W12 TaxID=3126507 RepID=UPI0030CD140C
MLKLGQEGGEDALSAIVRDLMAQEMAGFALELESALAPQQGYLTQAEMDLYQGGKKVRPLLLLLSARLFQPQQALPRKVLRASASLEMLHVATLIHDDIVDHASLRRGQSSVNAARGTEMAILIGDMQFLQAVRCFTDAIETERDMQLVRWVLDTAFEICKGEIDEMTTRPQASPQALHARYLSTIDRKTAVLFSLACESGAALMQAGKSDVRRLGEYGRRLGRAFQMMDDLLDVAHSDSAAGKRKGQDLQQKRLTLPLIHAMQLWGDAHPMVRYLRSEEAADETQIAQWVEQIRHSEAFLQSYAEARNTALQARDALQGLPQGPHLQAMRALCMQVVERTF